MDAPVADRCAPIVRQCPGRPSNVAAGRDLAHCRGTDDGHATCAHYETYATGMKPLVYHANGAWTCANYEPTKG